MRPARVSRLTLLAPANKVCILQANLACIIGLYLSNMFVFFLVVFVDFLSFFFGFVLFCFVFLWSYVLFPARSLLPRWRQKIEIFPYCLLLDAKTWPLFWGWPLLKETPWCGPKHNPSNRASFFLFLCSFLNSQNRVSAIRLKLVKNCPNLR